MAVVLESVTKRFIGLSTDDKPESHRAKSTTDTSADVIPAGSSFLESDTGKIYRWDGEAWRCHEPADTQLQTLQYILAELTQIRELVQITAG